MNFILGEVYKMSKGIFWVSVSLSENFKNMLRYEKKPHTHVTLQFNVEKSALEHMIGQEVPVKVIALCESDEIGIQAFLVEIPKKFKEICNNKFPHITLSHKPETSPFKSNEMLESKHFITRIETNFVCLKGVIEFFEFMN